MVTAPTRKGPVDHASFSRPIPLNFESNVDDASNNKQRGEYKLTGIGNAEFRALVPLEHKVAQGEMDQAIATIVGKAGTSPTKLELTIIDTDTVEVTITITGNTDGTYKATINGVDHDFAASGNTIEQIRDGLKAVIDGGVQPVLTSNVDTDSIKVVQDITTSKDVFTLIVTAPGAPDMTRSYDIAAVKGQNTIYRSENNTITPADLPDQALNDPTPPIKFSIKGTQGVLQVVILLVGADGTTDFDIIIEISGRELG